MQHSPDIGQKIDHLFRHESGKLVAVIAKIFGPHNLELAEDVVQDTLLKAMHNWKINGLPENPSGWLFVAAKNKALDTIRKGKRDREYAAGISYLLQSEYTLSYTVNELMNEDAIKDDQLRMMFACCHPSLPGESQVALVLKTLCGFSVSEIARAFLTHPDTIEKRLYRARQKFREKVIELEIPQEKEITKRMQPVLTAIYLLFNEGYNSMHSEELIRGDLLDESMRLCELLTENTATRKPEVYALLALMCFNHSRSNARIGPDGDILLLKEQDRKRWSQPLIENGLVYMESAATEEVLTSYHLEAAIALEHATAASYDQTNWANILLFYNLLYNMNPSAIIALNRSVAVGELYGPDEAIRSIQAISDIDSLEDYYLLHAIKGELYLRLGEGEKAKSSFSKAVALTSSGKEKKLLENKIAALK